MTLPAVGSVWRDSNGVFYLVKFSHTDDERIILSRFDDENITTIASYLDGFEPVWPPPHISDAAIDAIAERMLKKFLNTPLPHEAPLLWGPRIPLPVAPPVECYICHDEHGMRFVLWNESDAEAAKRDNCTVTRGVFIPTSVEESNAD